MTRVHSYRCEGCAGVGLPDMDNLGLYLRRALDGASPLARGYEV